MLTRRQFLKTGLIGGALLAGAGALHMARQVAPPAGLPTLDRAQQEIVAAVAPAILAGTLPQTGREEAVREAVLGVEKAVSGLSLAAQEELSQLFALLSFAPARILLAGLVDPWSRVTPAQAAAFLERWRRSRFDLLRSAYQALHDLVLGAWYGQESRWAAIGYPGPPEVPR